MRKIICLKKKKKSRLGKVVSHLDSTCRRVHSACSKHSGSWWPICHLRSPGSLLCPSIPTSALHSSPQGSSRQPSPIKFPVGLLPSSLAVPSPPFGWCPPHLARNVGAPLGLGLRALDPKLSLYTSMAPKVLIPPQPDSTRYFTGCGSKHTQILCTPQHVKSWFECHLSSTLIFRQTT